MTDAIPIHINGDYVVIPRAEYLRLLGGLTIAETKDALEAEFVRRLRIARDFAGLTQSELAKKLKVTQVTVSNAERGAMRVGDAYFARVLKACKLPADWVPPA